MSKDSRAACLFSLLLLAGCAHYSVNQPLKHPDAHAGYRFDKTPATPENTDNLFVVVTFSGGGTRAAALAYGVLCQLSNTVVHAQGRQVRMLDEVDVISSVSGGSFTAAYYALYGDRIFRDFEVRFLKRNIQAALLWRLASPYNWVRLLSPSFSRVDIAAEYYDERIFDHHTFGDLVEQGGRPFIILNATDMSLGSRFEFTQDQFDLIGSDLSRFPVSCGAAASSAFPGAFTPLTLRNYPHNPEWRLPDWVALAQRDRTINPPRYRSAMDACSYTNAAQRPFIHLIDGGVTDNLGIRGPLRSLESTDGGWSLARMINQGKIRKVVFITVDAKTQPAVSWDLCGRPPGMIDVLKCVTRSTVDNLSFDSQILLKRDIDSLRQDTKAQSDSSVSNSPLPLVDFYHIEVSFDCIKDTVIRQYLQSLPTTFHLPSTDVDILRNAGAEILSRSPEYRQLLKDLGK